MRVRAAWLGLTLLALLGLLAASQQIWLTGTHSNQGNEGWLGLEVAAVLAGKPVYPSASEYFVSNYLPTSFLPYIVLHLLTGDLIVAGRWFSWGALAVLSAECFAITWLMTRQAISAAFSSALVLCLFGRWFNGSIGIAEPQLLGHVFALASVWLLVKCGLGLRPLGFATVCLFIAGLIKPNLIGFPLGIALWLFLEDRRRFIQWAVACTACLIAIGAMMFAAFGPTELADNIFLGRTYRIAHLFTNLRYLGAFAVPLLCSGALVGAKVPGGGQRLLLCLLLGSLAACILVGGIVGTAANSTYDFALAASIGAGVATRYRNERLLPSADAHSAVILACGAMIIRTVLGFDVGNLSSLTSVQSRDAMRTEDEAAREIIALLASRAGPGACVKLSFCYWAGKTDRVDLSGRYETLFSPVRDSTPLIDDLEHRRFSVIEFSPWTSGSPASMGGSRVEIAIQENYEILETFWLPFEGASTSVLVPKER